MVRGPVIHFQTAYLLPGWPGRKAYGSSPLTQHAEFPRAFPSDHSNFLMVAGVRRTRQIAVGIPNEANMTSQVSEIGHKSKLARDKKIGKSRTWDEPDASAGAMNGRVYHHTHPPTAFNCPTKLNVCSASSTPLWSCQTRKG